MPGKFRWAQRDQLEWRCESLNQQLPPEHPVRSLWAFVCKLDLSAWTSRVRSRQGSSGAPAIDPRILVALWLQATLDGVGSSRQLSKLCTEHLVYRWLCGGEAVNYHTLSDFRGSDPSWLEGVLAQSAAALLHANLADLTRVAQDGVRVRANAGSDSFRREPTLRDRLAEVEQQLAALKEQASRGGAPSKSESARQRAAAERQQRLELALENLDELREINAQRRASKKKDPTQLRASMTDPQARKMKMADGGFRPAYNVQFATTTEGGVVVGVSVTQEGYDNNQLVPMLERIERLYGQRPQELLVDGGYVDAQQIEYAEKVLGVHILAPLRDVEDFQQRGQDPFARREHDGEGTARWRARMGTEAGKASYRWRAQIAEWVHARARNRGLRQFLVRGLKKALSSSLLFALAHNLTQALTLPRQQRVIAAA